MPIPVLVNQRRSPERIFAYGGPGAGKSHALLTIANRIPTSQFHVLDNDNAYLAMLDEQFPTLTNVHIHPVYNWSETKKLTSQLIGDPARGIQPSIQPHDWFVHDIAGKAWAQVQDWFTNEVFSASKAEYFLSVRKALAADASSLGAFEGFTDWSVINPEFQEWVNMLLNSQSNVWCTAAADKMRPDSRGGKAGETRDTKDMFESVGWKPIGQKTFAHTFKTLLFMNKQRTPGTIASPLGGTAWFFSTIKDRGREPGVVEKPWNDFGIQYLMEIAGWKVEVR